LNHFPPEVNAPANRTFEHCKEWVKNGVEVTVITCVPNFPKGKVYKGYKNKLIQKEEVEGIKVIRVWSYIAANEGFVKRILDYISFSISSFIAGLLIKTDVIIATSPQFFSAISGRWLSFFKRKPWIFEVRDLWPESIIAVGAMKRNLFIKFFEKVELRLYKSAKKIIVVTDSFKSKIVYKGINQNKIDVFKNGANLELYFPCEKKLSILEQYNLQNKFVFAYVGTHGMAHGLNFILDSIVELEKTNPNFHFLFIGDGAERQNLIKQSRQLLLNNVTFIESVSKKDVVDYLNIADVALVNLKKSETFHTVIPSKIFEAAAMEKPILLGLEGETKEIIENFNAGITYLPENKKDFLNAVSEISKTETYEQKRIGAKNLANAFERKKIALEMLLSIKNTK